MKTPKASEVSERANEVSAALINRLKRAGKDHGNKADPDGVYYALGYMSAMLSNILEEVEETSPLLALRIYAMIAAREG
jgi:hypothetical protein